MRRSLVTCAVLVVLLAMPVYAEDLFLHIDVEEVGDDGMVQINLPLALVEFGTRVMPRPFHIDGRITVGNLGITRSDVEALQEALADLDGGQSTVLRFGRRKVSVEEAGGLVTLHSPARGFWDEEVEIRVPTQVLDAFLGDGDELDLMSGFRALADHPESVILVADDNGRSQARIWVDGYTDIRR